MIYILASCYKKLSRIFVQQGVVACDPDEMELPLPSSATELRCGAWVLSGNSILKDGRSIQVIITFNSELRHT